MWKDKVTNVERAGGNSCPNKAAEARKSLETICRNFIKLGLTYTIEAHATDGTTEVHRDPEPIVLPAGGVDFVSAHLQRL